MSQPNELRVFISSTFRDMQEEREHLVKKIFPEIRALCRQRGITFTEVDLRWGLTDEDVVFGQVIRTCLEEIDKCRPYFIGLVGERYGWAPPMHEYYKDPELLTRWPWLEDAALAGSSITDIEFRHGALNDPSRAEYVRFFFRRQRRTLPDASPATDSDEEHEKLVALKERIRDAGLMVEEFRDPVSLGELIYDELIGIIERDFAEAKPPTPLEQERSRHAAFAASRRRAYIPNPQYLKRLNEWFATGEQPLVLYAESGSGKSSLVSFWCDQLRRRQPQLHVIEHYVGIGAGDSSHLGIIGHVIEEVRERYDRSEEIPSRPEQLERAFANWLGFNLGAPMLLVIDGINQLSGRALDLHWLPPVMPEGVKLIVSSTVEQTLVDLRRRGWSELGMQPLSESEREAVVVRFLAEYSKALSAEQVRRVASDAKCAHPLFLRTLLEELRVHGMHEHLDRTLENLLNTTGTEDLFQRVLERLEDDYSQKAVREVLSLIWASRSGLSEEDLEALTGIGRMKLSSMLLGLDYHLLRRDGLLSFFHDYLRRAVEKRYLSKPELRLLCHEHLAEHFERTELTLRSTLELLHALSSLGQRERVEGVMSNMARFELLWRTDRLEVLAQWSQSVPETIAEAYRAGVDTWTRTQSPSPERQSEVLGMVAELLSSVADFREAYRLQNQRLRLVQELGDREGESHALSALSWYARGLGRMEEANDFARRSEAVARELGDRRRILNALAYQGVLHHSLGENGNALDRFREAESIARELGDRAGLARCVGNRGIVHHSIGEHGEALACYAESEQLLQQLGDRQGMPSTVGNRGLVHAHRGEYAEALACYRTMERMAREMGDRRNIAASLANRAAVHTDLGEYAEALACYGEAEQIALEIGDQYVVWAAVGNRGRVYASLGDYEEALAAYDQAMTGHRSLGSRHGVSVWLKSIGEVLLAMIDRSDATVPQGMMPEFLQRYVPHAEPETWRNDALQAVGENVLQSMEIARELSRADMLHECRVLLARVAVAAGDRAGGIGDLEEMLRETTDDGHRAEIHYWLWKFGVTDTEHHGEALRLYTALHARIPKQSYASMLDDLRAASSPPSPTAEADDVATD